jgi:hypothetical protein
MIRPRRFRKWVRAVSTCAVTGLVIVLSIDGAAAVSLTDLQGAVVEATIVRRNLYKRASGQTSESDVREIRRITVNAGGTVTVRTSTQDDFGRSTSSTVTYLVGKPHTSSSSGGGDSVAVFMNNTLSFLRTYSSGARRTSVVFRQSNTNLSCTAGMSFARETGRGAIGFTSDFDGLPFQILRSRVVTTSCVVRN